MHSHLKLAIAAAALLLPSALLATDPAVRFEPMPGSKVRIEGTSSVHDWQVESQLIGGYLEAGPGFPTQPGQAASPGKIQAKAQAFIPVRSLKSIEKDGRPYSDSMDDIMYGKLLLPANPRISYYLDQLTLKQAPKDAGSSYVCDSTGELVVAGVTNKISMPVEITPLGANSLKITGRTAVKMTEFAIKPPAPAIALGLIKTGDEVKLIFDWRVRQKPAAAQAR